MLSFNTVSHRYGDTGVLDNVDLRLAEGETTALIGPSGCGKSTLLKLAAGLIWPTAGSVAIFGTTLTPHVILDQRRRMGYVIQSGGLFPHLTAHGNVTLLARHLRKSADWVANRVTELAELTRLPAELLTRYPSELSGGQRQRVSLMRALLLDPDLLLLDEPLAALDPMVRYDLQEDLKALCARLRKTVLLVTHDMAEAAFFSDRIVLMRAGRIVQQGSVEQLMHTPASDFVSDFLRAQRSLHLPAA